MKRTDKKNQDETRKQNKIIYRLTIIGFILEVLDKIHSWFF
ncbi:hypothetical protein [Ligilactobacillus salivarius]|nr:hypothetical protein [Ligilactobacillus salivarius]